MANVDNLNVASASKKAPPVPPGSLYAIWDTTLIAVAGKPPDGDHTTARYRRLSFTGSAQEPQATVNDTIDFGPFDDIRSARVVSHPSGKQEVALLTKTGLSFIAMTEEKSGMTTVRSKVDDVALIIGVDPILTAKRALALLVSTDAGFAVVEVDMDSGVRDAPRQLPPAVQGKAVAAELVRRGASTMLVLVTVGAQLQVHAVAWEDLAQRMTEQHVETLTLGDVLADPAAVDVSVTSMRAKSADQQIAVAWPDTASTAKIALVGWGAGGEATLLAMVAPELTSPGRPVCRLAAADLLHTETEQLVFGHLVLPVNHYPDSPRAELMLFILDESAGPPASLKCFSKLVYTIDVSPTFIGDHVPDLHLAAGVFGTSMAIQVIHDWRFPPGPYIDYPMSLACCGFFPVDPNLGLTEGGRHWADIPSLRVVDQSDPIMGFWNSIICFPSDLAGQSVRLGEPQLTPVDACSQILAVIQAPPYDSNLKKDPPTIIYSKSNSETSGYSVSSDSAYSLSKDFGLHLQIGSLSLGTSVQNAWTQSFNKVQDRSESRDVSFSATGDVHDFLLVYARSYNVWRYPVTWSSGRAAPGDEILVVVPTAAEPQMQIVPGYHPDYGYSPRSEVGMLLSYVDVHKDGFTEANRLFQPAAISVSESSSGSSESGSDLKSNSDTVGKHYSVSNSISGSASFTAQTELFDFLPVSFGLNVSGHEVFADSTVDTTHVTRSEHMNWSVNSGSVQDSIYSYDIIPCIYIHEKLGFLVISWDVDLSPGTNYNLKEPVQAQMRRLDDPDICLIRVAPFSYDPYQKWYSRSIRFDDTTPGKLTIQVDVFNNSINPAKEVTCEFFEGKPTPVGEKEEGKLEPPGKKLGEATCPELPAHGRPTQPLLLTVPRPEKTPCYFTVRVSCTGPPTKKTYWNIYPADSFATPQSVSLAALQSIGP